MSENRPCDLAVLTDASWGVLLASVSIDPDGWERIAVGLELAAEDATLHPEAVEVLKILGSRLRALIDPLRA